MTTPVQAITALQQYFNTNFTAAGKSFDNEPLTQRDEAYVHFSVQLGDSQPNADSTFKRTVGVAFCVVRVPKGLGDLVAWTLAQTAAGVLELKNISGVRLTSAGFLNAGLVGDNLQVDSGWYQINVSVPFWFEHYV